MESELVGGNSFLFWTLEALCARVIHMASSLPNQEAHQCHIHAQSSDLVHTRS